MIQPEHRVTVFGWQDNMFAKNNIHLTQKHGKIYRVFIIVKMFFKNIENVA